MSESKNKGIDNRPAKKVPASKIVDKQPARKRTGLLVAVLVIAVIGVIAGVSIYWTQARPFQQTVIVVDDASINMGYFLKRTRMAGGDPMALLSTLTNELIIKKAAPQSPYNIKVTPEDIDETLRALFRGESEIITDDEFEEWYRQQLNETELSDAEYRDLMYTTLLASQLHMYLAERVPTVAEHRHLHIILVESYEEADAVRARWEAGEDFADLAREVSLDASGENGGDVGWLPRGASVYGFELAAFSLSIGDASQPLRFTEEESYCLLMVSEEAAAREVNEEDLDILKGRALEDWLISEIQLHIVEFHGRSNGFDSETYAWIQWQLQRMSE